jgi:hypothetical protein
MVIASTAAVTAVVRAGIYDAARERSRRCRSGSHSQPRGLPHIQTTSAVAMTTTHAVCALVVMPAAQG